MRRTKIVATVGPATASEEVLRNILMAGVDVVRVNFSHGTHETHAAVVSSVRRIAREIERPVAILQDLCGPKIRTGVIAGGATSIPLRDGDVLEFVGGEASSVPGRVGISYAGLAAQCSPGARIFIDDGLIEVRVDSVRGENVRCTVVRGGDLYSRKGVNLPGAAFAGMAALTEKDLVDLEFGILHQVDYVGLSFVRRPEDVLLLKRRIQAAGAKIGVIAKIEKPQALECLDAIVEAADGIMVARGDLGVELDPERVPFAQKEIIRACNARERPVITATQMLESMTKAPRPTRAEVSDVANAIFDGTDAVMLSGETASGKHPVEAVQMMARICEASDSHLRVNHAERQRTAGQRPDTVLEAVGRAAELLARELDIKVIVAATVDGTSALGISKSRPEAIVIALSPDEAILRRMNLYWGVLPLRCTAFTERSELIRLAERVAISRKVATTGDFLVLVSNSPVDAPGAPNNLRLHQIGAVRTGDTVHMRIPDLRA